MNGKTIKTYQQFVDYVFNSNAEQFVIFDGKKSTTLCTVESANKEINKLKTRIEKLEKEVNFQKHRADLYKRCFDILKERNKLILKTLLNLKGSARWERHLYELNHLIAITKGREDGWKQ